MGLPREHRLAGGRRIREVLRTGRSAGSSLGRLHVGHRGDEAPPRLACAFSRRLGGAVRRNRGRRRVQACFLALAPRLQRGFDLVLRAQSGAMDLEFAELGHQLERLLRQTGVMAEPDDAPRGRRGDAPVAD